MLLGNAQLEQVYTTALDSYGSESQGGLVWHGRVACKVVDRVRTSMLVGPEDSYHQTVIWLPAGLIADDGTPLALFVDYQLSVRQDGVVTAYRVTDWSDWGQRLLASPSDIRVFVERHAA